MRTGSDSGYHFVQDYRKCKRYFYHKYVNKLAPVETAPALLFGHSMHGAMETWYTLLKKAKPVHERVRESLKTFEVRMNERMDEYAYHDRFLDDLQRGQNILRNYGLQYPNENWIVLAIEEDLQKVFSTGHVFTGRADLVVMSREGRVYLIDHKFTGWSLNNVIKSHQNSDQATAYKMLWDEKYPDKPINACIFNICRAYKTNTEFHQLAVAKTFKDVEEFSKGIEDDLYRMQQRLADPDSTWPKNTDRCMDFNRPCDYLPLCQGSNFEGLVGVKYKIREEGE